LGDVACSSIARFSPACGWSVRYWRVSSTKNSASRPNGTLRYNCMFGPCGSDSFRSGIIS
jgi:hypothetical protein